MDQDKHLQGIFSGGPDDGRAFYFGREEADGAVSVRALDDDFQATGEPAAVPRDEFLAAYDLEPELSYKLISQRIMRGDLLRKSRKFAEAETEYQGVRGVDENNIRANFGLGLAYLEAGQHRKAEVVFDRLVELDETFDERHKHLFNELGISLRKQRLFDLTLKYYSRALKLILDEDENLHFNMARALYEKGELAEMFRHLRKTLEICPDMAEGRRFLDFLDRSGVTPQTAEDQRFFASLAG